MNAEQQAELARKISDKMLDRATTIGYSTPARLNQNIREAIPTAIVTLVGQAGSISDATDAQIGEAFRDAVNTHIDGTPYRMARVAPEVMGAWLRAAYTEFSADETVPDGNPYPVIADCRPLYTSVPSGHTDALRTWADNDNRDVLDGVDEQATYLRGIGVILPVNGQPWAPWADLPAFTTGEAKDFLGAVMRYKKARLASKFEGAEPSFLTERPAVGTRVTITQQSRGTAYRLEVGNLTTVTKFSDTNPEVVWCVPDGSEPLPDSASGCWVEWTDISTADVLRVPYESVTTQAQVEGPVGNAVTVDDNQALRTEVAVLKGEVQRRREAHEADIALIGERLMSEAQSRSWCSEYDQIVSDLNATLTVELPVREQDREMRVSGTITLPFCVTVTIQSNGDDDDDETAAREAVDANYSASTLVRDYTDFYSAETDDSEYWEVEEA